MKTINTLPAMAAGLLLLGCNPSPDRSAEVYPKFVIEREIPGAGKLTAQELKDASKKSCDVLRQLGPEIQWLQSYVTADKVYCVYTAPDKDLIIRHAQLVGIPANRISEVSSIVSPATAE